MALPDITIDTNVLLHACNPNEGRCADSIKLLTTLLATTASLAIDAGFNIDPAKNTSLIGGEYLQKLVPGTLAFSAIAAMASSRRMAVYTAAMSPQTSRKLNQLVANRRDRTFVKVCANSRGKSLVSHDFADFPTAKRRELQKQLTLQIVDAGFACSLI